MTAGARRFAAHLFVPAFCAVVLAAPRAAWARQATDEAPRFDSSMRLGQKVWVTFADGTQASGRVKELSRTLFGLSQAQSGIRRIDAANVMKIETVDDIGDGIGRGAAVGMLGVGGSAFAVTMLACANEGGSCAGVGLIRFLLFGGIGAAGGAAIGGALDAAFEGRRTLFERRGPVVSLAPIVSRHSKGLGVTIRW